MSAGFAISAQSAYGMGNAYAGNAAVANDASTVVTNPAGILELDNAVFGVSLPFTSTLASYNDKGSLTNSAIGPFSAQPVAVRDDSLTSLDQRSVTPTPALYYARKLNDQWAFGLGLHIPFGTSSDYGDNWIGRYQAVETAVTAFDINPTVAYRINDKVSVGGGLSVQFANALLTSKLDSGVTCFGIAGQAGLPVTDCLADELRLFPNNPNLDSTVELDGSGTAVTFNIGVLLKPQDGTRIGIAYRHGAEHSLKGDATFTNYPALGAFVGNLPEGRRPLQNTGTTISANLPATLDFSVAQMANEKLEILGTIKLTKWSSFDALTSTFDNPVQTPSVLDFNWDDTITLSSGVNYALNDKTTLRSGLSFDQSPIPNPQSRSARGPAEDRIWISFGGTYKFTKSISADAMSICLRSNLTGISFEAVIMNNSNRKSLKVIAACIVTPGLLIGCNSSTNFDFENSKLEQQQQVELSAVYDPANAQFPLPNDLLFSGSEDGTLNIPVDDPLDFSNPRVAMNATDGFSTTEPAIVNFAQSAEFTVSAIDATSVKLGETARIFEVTRDPASGAVTDVVEELDDMSVRAMVIPTDPTTSANGTSIAFAPLRPFKESTTYMAMLTNGVTNNLGTNLERGTVFDVLASDEVQEDPQAAGLQALIQAMLAAGNAAGVPAEDVIMAWSFTTQSISPVIQTLKDSAVATQITMGDNPVGETGALSETSPNLANIFAGQMSVPYYLEAPSQENPAAPLTTFFKNATGGFLNPLDNVPISTGQVTIPVLMTKPKGTPPETGWPIAIFQHGITRSRADMLALADAMANAEFAMIAIDIPVHGIVPGDDAAIFIQAGIERHFDMDFANNETGEQEPDGKADRSGQYYYNLRNLLNTRDNTRQAVADLFTLSASLGSLDDIDPSRKVFIGHSLGAIIGTTFVAFDDTVTKASLSSGGGGLSRLLAASPEFGPAIAEGLSAAGIEPDGESGNAFLNAAQTVVDSSDPINHAARLAASSTDIHMTQVNNDTVVINNLGGFPLVGTEALAYNLNLDNVTETTQGRGFVKFEPGYHSSLLSPAVDENNSLVTITAEQAAAVFIEMQKQVATFAVSGTIVIEDTSVIATPTQ